MKTSRGFTLIEILVVLFIMSIIISLVVVNPRAFTSSASSLRNFSQEMVLRLKFAKEYAISSQSTLGLEIQPDAWNFQIFTQNKWEQMDTPKPLQAQNTPRDIQLRLESSVQRGPQVIFYGSGELTPFVITCEQPKSSMPIRIIGKANGDISLE